MTVARAPERILPDRVLDWSPAVLGVWFLLGAYLDAWDRSQPPRCQASSHPGTWRP